MIVEVLLIVVVTLFFILYHISKRKFGYWKERNIPYLEPVPILGNYGPFIMQRKYNGKMAQELCQKFPDEPYFGVFYGTEPTLMVQDPEMIKTVMTKDFYYFSCREISNYTHREVFTQNLFFICGHKWRVLRQNLTPLFSSSKMKNMFYLIEECVQVFEGMLDRDIKVNNVQGVRHLMARFTMDCIGLCAFGIETKTMEQDSRKNPFTSIAAIMFMESYIRGTMIVVRAIWPALFYGLGIKLFPKIALNFFKKLMRGVFEDRQYKPTNRNDFVDLILNWKKNNFISGDSLQNMKGGENKVRLEIDDEMLVSQCMLFFAAGFETSSTTLQYLLYELAKDRKAQQKVIGEVDEYLQLHKNKLEYECTTELPFTEACIDEALRLYPAVGILTRELVEDYTLPCGAVIGNGIRVHIPVYHLHHNPKFFTDPEMFRPERFYKQKRDVIPYTHIPFGEGPRACIGMRFAKMQMFSGIITLLKKYQVELAADTPRKLNFKSTTLVTQPKELIKLKFVEREGWEKRMFNK
ncbi:cytochrome P450 6B2 [Amyelois transitella]|uniref:cytochrome P450 6B2 n=1 Tax=Amyelois transitella TaxID=680683 RepID=UPI00298FA52D|nr:cytochrome P450 6B2 [Amyelois transitella]